MDINQLVSGKEYKMTHAGGQPNQKVKVLNVSTKNHPKWGDYVNADIIYTSDDLTKGLRTSVNKIECERYIHELNPDGTYN